MKLQDVAVGLFIVELRDKLLVRSNRAIFVSVPPKQVLAPSLLRLRPYTVKEINSDSIVYEAREDYYRGTPEIKNIVLKVVGSGSTKSIAFENGEIDYMRITTVDELEKLTGFDFFAAMDDNIEAEVEKSYKLSFWKL